MLRRFSIDFAIFTMFVDAVMVSAAVYFGVSIRPSLSRFTTFAKEFHGPYILSPWLIPIFFVTWISILLLFSVYDGRKNFRFMDELGALTLASGLATVSIAGILYLTFRDFSRALFGLFVIIAYLEMVAIRMFYRFYFRLRASRGIQFRRTLIIGAGLIGRKFAASIQQYRDFGLQMVGFLDDDPKKTTEKDVLGSLEDARLIVTRFKINDVVVTLPQRAFERSAQLALTLQDLPVRLWVVPDYFSLALTQAGIDNLGGIPMINLRAPALNDYQRMIKRIFDLIVSLAAAPFVFPIMALIAIAIRLDSSGPALFYQARVGENGRVFKMIKFRTMVENAEQLRNLIEEIDTKGKIIQVKSRSDPRITRIGKILRKTSLDELPQLFNVLRGDMSLVGPRPELPHLVDQYEPWQRARFAVPQGMTGWWQIQGRSERPMHLNTEDDLYYVKNYSLWLDLKIILRTIGVVLNRKGAF